MKLLCIDGNSVINRAFFGIKILSTRQGEFTNAIVGFMNILLKLTEQEKPDAVAIAFDLPKKTFRHELYDGYKAGRSPMPEELKSQLPIIKELLEKLGYSIVSCEGYEADDIIGTLSKNCSENGIDCIIASGDRDGQQLVTSSVKLLLTTTQFGRGETNLIDEEAIMDKYGVSPKQLIDVKGLAGDASDKIPGAKGIGEVTACKLIARFGSIEGIYENIESNEIKPAARQKLIDSKDMVYLSRTLAEINCNVPIDTDPTRYIKSAGDSNQAAALLSRLEMTKLKDRLGLENIKATGGYKTNKLTEGVVTDNGSRLFVVCNEDNVVTITDGSTYEVIDPNGLKFREVLSSETEKHCFDAKSIYKIALQKSIEVNNITFDAKLAAYLLNPSAKDYNVKDISAEYGIESECWEDCIVTLFNLLQKEMNDAEMQKLHDEIELPLSKVLSDMEIIGFAVDQDGIENFGTELKGRADTLVKEIFSDVGYEFNINSPKQLGVVLFEVLDLPTGKKTKSGYSTNAETLERLKLYHPAVEKILEYRTLQKLISTYVEGLISQIDEDGRIHTFFKQTETRTGRISSKEPNLQNIPIRTELGRELRKFFVAPEGRSLVDADYSQIELRILASLSDDKEMQNAFISGEDIHLTTAAKVFELPPLMVTEDMRRSAKAVNFGIVYGIGAFSLAKDIGVTVKEADRFIKNYLSEFSGVDKYLKETVENAKLNGYVTTHFGRRRVIPELKAGNINIKKMGERIAMNTPIQGTAADIIKLAMIKVHKKIEELDIDAKLILQVHDELLVECESSLTETVKKILEQEMEFAAKLAVELVAETGSGKNWLEAH